MKRLIAIYKSNYSIVFFIAIFAVFFVFFPDVVLAEEKSYIFGSAKDIWYGMISTILNILLWLASWSVWITGMLLDMSVSLTLNMKQLAELESINLVWKTIRDVSGIFFIGTLIYASINIILNRGKSKIKEVVVGVVVAGVLLNFTLYGTKVIVDAGNITSLALYKAIAPGGNGRDLSFVFMQALKVQSIYDGAAVLKNTDTTKITMNIILVAIFGIILMIVVSLSFLATAIVFFFRTFMLLGVMAFSPIWVIGMILPRASGYSKKWAGYLIGYSFAPAIYFFLSYIGLRVLTDESFNKTLFTLTGGTGNPNTSTFGAIVTYSKDSIGVLLLFLITIFLMYSAVGAMISFLKENGISHKWVDALGKAAEGFQGTALGWVKRNSVGLAASKFAESGAMQKYAGTTVGRTFGGGLAMKAVSNVAKDYNKQKKEDMESYKEAAKSIRPNKERIQLLNRELAIKEREHQEYQNNKELSQAKLNDIKTKIKEMEKEGKNDEESIATYLDLTEKVKSAEKDYSKYTSVDGVKREQELKEAKKKAKEALKAEEKAPEKAYANSIWTKINAGGRELGVESEKAEISEDIDRIKKTIDEIKSRRTRLIEMAKSKSGLSDLEIEELERLNGDFLKNTDELENKNEKLRSLSKK